VQELEKRRTAEIEELDALLARCKAEVEKYEKAIATFIANIRQVYRPLSPFRRRACCSRESCVPRLAHTTHHCTTDGG
jgi:hypothetical protein